MGRQVSAEEAEFGTVAAWTAEATVALGVDRLPAACNGSGSPAALGWLADRLGAGAGAAVLDTGAGLGGPAEWLARRTGARLVTAEPMVPASRGGRRLFGRPGVVAWSHELPFAAASFGAAVALAVLSTVADKESYLAEVRRVLAPGGRLGLLDYVRTGPVVDPPAGNDFLDARSLSDLIGRSGFSVEAERAAGPLADPPPSWKEVSDRVAEAVAAAHPGDPALAAADRDRDRFARLVSDGTLEVWLLVARREG